MTPEQPLTVSGSSSQSQTLQQNGDQSTGSTLTVRDTFLPPCDPNRGGPSRTLTGTVTGRVVTHVLRGRWDPSGGVLLSYPTSALKERIMYLWMYYRN